MRIDVYQNNKNEHKYLEVKHYADGHYYWRQHLYFPQTNVTYFPGIGLHQKPRFFRVRKWWAFTQVINTDYTFAYSYNK